MLTRRVVLTGATRVVAASALTLAVGGVAAALSSCTPRDDVADDLAAGIDAELRLIAAYVSAAAVLPDLAPLLGAVADNHRAHLDELRRLAGLPDPVEDGAEASPSPSPTPPGVDRAATVQSLRDQEVASAAAARTRAADTYGERSGTHAAVAACEDSHAVVLATWGAA